MTDHRLTPFEGRDVLSAKIKVTGAGDGLSEAMKVEPIEMHAGERVYVVMECDVTKLTFEPIKNAEGFMRVHVLRAGAATIVDRDLVQAHLEAQQERIDKAKGVERLPFGEEPTGPLPPNLAALEGGKTQPARRARTKRAPGGTAKK